MRALLLAAVLLSVAHIPTPSQSYTLPYQCTVCRRTMTRFWQQGGDVAALDEAKLCPDIDPDVTHKYCILFENGRCQAWEKSPFYDDNHKVGGNITNPFHPAFSLLSVHERIRIIHHATRLRRYRAFRALLQARKEELEEKEAAAESAEEDSSVSFDAAEAPRLAAERGDGSYKQSEDKRIDPITQLPCSIIGCAHLDGSKPKEPPKPYPDEWCKEIVRFIKNDPLTMQIKAKGCTVKSAGGGYSTHGNFEYRHECPEFAYCTCLRNEKGAAWCAPQAPAPICTPGEPPENLGKEAQLMEEKKLEKSLKNMDALSKKAGDEWFFQTQGPDAYPN